MTSDHSWIWALLSLVVVAGLNWVYWPQFKKVRQDEPDTFLGFARAQFLAASVVVLLVTILTVAVLSFWAWRILFHL